MKLHLSIGQRLALGFFVMGALVFVASSIGVWYSMVTGRAIDATQQGIKQVEGAVNLQLRWSEVAAVVDNMLLTRQTSLVEQQLENTVNEFNEQLIAVQNQPLGQSPEVVAQNQKIVGDLQLLGAELTNIVAELKAVAQEGRWARTQTLRHTELASIQRRFDEAIEQLSSNIQAEVDGLAIESGRTQNIFRVYWSITVIVALVSGIVSGVLTIRSISRPVNDLIEQVERVTRRDFSPVTPLSQRDEIGDLSRAFVLMTDWLRESYQTLEQRVADRTERLETVAEVSERFSAILNLKELLGEVVNQSKDRFGYYHTHIYLFDDTGEKLVVAEGTGEAGEAMKKAGHSIPLSAPQSLVARAARTGQAVRVDNVREAPDWLPNPLLPDTHSEMAVAIILEGQAVGVLDVQSEKIAGFDEGDVGLLRSLANSVAVAIRNARLFEEVESALSEARAAQQRYQEQAWAKGEDSEQYGACDYQQSGAPLLDQKIVTQLEQKAMAQDRPLITTVNGPQASSPAEGVERETDGMQSALLAPIKLQDQTIGAIQLHQTETAQQRQWSERDLALLEAVAEQVAQTAENLRLFDETRERAGREQAIREITDKLRAAPNLDILLETAARELSQRLDVPHTVLEMGIETQNLKPKT